jgi:hypothetical protein
VVGSLSSILVKQALVELTSQFENDTGSKLVLDFGTVAQVHARVQSGELRDFSDDDKIETTRRIKDYRSFGLPCAHRVDF